MPQGGLSGMDGSSRMERSGSLSNLSFIESSSSESLRVRRGSVDSNGALSLDPPKLGESRSSEVGGVRVEGEQPAKKSLPTRMLDALKECVADFKKKSTLEKVFTVFKIAAAAAGIAAAISTGPAGIALASIGLAVVVLQQTGILNKMLEAIPNQQLRLAVSIGIGLLAASTLVFGGVMGGIGALGKVADVAAKFGQAAGILTQTAAIGGIVVASSKGIKDAVGAIKDASGAINKAVKKDQPSAADGVQKGAEELANKGKLETACKVFKCLAAVVAAVAAAATAAAAVVSGDPGTAWAMVGLASAALLAALTIFQEAGGTEAVMKKFGQGGAAAMVGIGMVLGFLGGGGAKTAVDVSKAQGAADKLQDAIDKGKDVGELMNKASEALEKAVATGLSSTAEMFDVAAKNQKAYRALPPKEGPQVQPQVQPQPRVEDEQQSVREVSDRVSERLSRSSSMTVEEQQSMRESLEHALVLEETVEEQLQNVRVAQELRNAFIGDFQHI
jgi:hypothetical protein